MKYILLSTLILSISLIAHGDDFDGMSNGMSACDTAGSNYELEVDPNEGEYTPAEGSPDTLQCDSTNTDMYGNSLCD